MKQVASLLILSLLLLPLKGRARQLVQAGIRSPVELVQYTASDLSQKIEHLYTGQAGKLIKAAKVSPCMKSISFSLTCHITDTLN